MVRIPGAAFLMGSDDHYPEEAPAHKVTVGGFWIDAGPVTNREFGRFVRKTGYVTVAERAPDPAEYPGARPELLVPFFLAGIGLHFDLSAFKNASTLALAGDLARLMDDINDDTTRLSSFYETAVRVLDMDEKRKKSLGFVAYAGPGERGDALARIKENASVVALVDASLAQRVASYRFALERLVIATPSSQAVEVERALTRLKAQVAYYRHVLPPSWQRVPSLDWQPT